MSTTLENIFKQDCQQLCSHIDPAFFISSDKRYYEDSLPYFKKFLHAFLEYTIVEKPNIGIQLTTRIKSPISLNQKHVKKIKKNMDTIINGTSSKKEETLNSLFSFLALDNEGRKKSDQIREIVNEYSFEEKAKRIDNVSSYLTPFCNTMDILSILEIFSINDLEKRKIMIDTLLPKEFSKEVKDKIINHTNDLIDKFDMNSIKEKFERIYLLLEKEQRQKLTRLLGKLYDILAFRIIVRDISFPICSVDNKDNILSIVDDKGISVPIVPAMKVKTSDIFQAENGLYWKSDITIKEDLSKRSTEELLQLENTGKIEKISERNFVYDNSIPSSKRNIKNATVDTDGNLTLLRDSIEIDNKNIPIFPDTLSLENNKLFINGEELMDYSNVKLFKYDEPTLRKSSSEIVDLLNTFIAQEKVKSIPKRYKDYIHSPKEDTGYRSIHMTLKDENYGYVMETQLRTLLMEDDNENKELVSGHSNYKDSKDYMQRLLNVPSISIDELLPHYILFTQVKDPFTGKKIVKEWEPDIDFVYEKEMNEPYQNFLKIRNEQLIDDDDLSID